MANFDEINPESTIDGIIKLNKELQNTNTTVAALLLENEKLKKQFEDIGASTKSVAEKSTAYQKTLSDTEKEQVKINASAKEMHRQEQALIAAEAKLIEANSKQSIEIQKKNKAYRDAQEVLKQEMILNDENSGKIEKARASNKLLQMQKRKTERNR